MYKIFIKADDISDYKYLQTISDFGIASKYITENRYVHTPNSTINKLKYNGFVFIRKFATTEIIVDCSQLDKLSYFIENTDTLGADVIRTAIKRKHTIKSILT